MKNFLIYGAYGYTGKLISEFAKEQGLSPILAGRSKDKLKQLAEKLGFQYKVFGLDEYDKLKEALNEVDAILHCAGPFEFTCDTVSKACLETKTHYLDITGEWTVFQKMHQLDNEAKNNGITIIPGTGFDVVPSDTLAHHLKQRVPDSIELNLYLSGSGAMSHGTAITMVENLGRGGLIRKDGELKHVKNMHESKEVEIDGKTYNAAAIPWGDVYTAYVSTSIPNIVVYLTLPPKAIKISRLSNYFSWVFNFRFIKDFLIKQVKKKPAGPSDEIREKGETKILGEVIDSKGNKFKSIFRGPEGYTLTALTALIIVKKVLNGDYKTGFHTPSSAYGEGVIDELKSAQIEDI
ncbi:MAG: saccharopine dehydrogenase NADP-binding domain-containing protein [Bacteroidota bacterium]